MKKRDVYVFPVGYQDFVIMHARYRATRGKRPSMPYKGERNPQIALTMALDDAIIRFEARFVNFANDLYPKNDGAKMPFVVEISHEKHSSHATFVEAYICLYNETMAVIKRGASLKWLATNFIKHTVKTPLGPIDCVLDFFQAKELAYIVDILKGSKLQELPRSVQPILVDMFFLKIELKNWKGVLRNIIETKQRKREINKK